MKNGSRLRILVGKKREIKRRKKSQRERVFKELRGKEKSIFSRWNEGVLSI